MKAMNRRNVAGFALLLVSVALLVPGLMNDILSLKAGFSVPILGYQEVLSERRSIISTIGHLADNGNGLVAFLILLFSVLVPFTKALVMAFVALSSGRSHAARMQRFVGIISKWSMADVFVVGIFIAFLSIKTNENISAELHSGFYFFTAYCLTSILAVQLIHVPASPPRTAVEG